MSKPYIYTAASTAIACILIGCQSPPANDWSAKVITYGRSQLGLNPSQALQIESQQPQTVNTVDICQTTEPTEVGFVVKLLAGDIRYILHTNADASKIEICGSEDAQPAATGKYTGAGYTLRYPANWQVIDFGLERSGASTVIFTPQLSAESVNPEAALQGLQKQLRTHVIIKRIPLSQADSAKLPEDAQNIGEVPFDYQVKAAKASSKVQFTEAIANSNNGSNNVTNWQVQALTLETEQFIYTIRYYQPDAPDLTKDGNKIPNQFEQFVSSFSLIP